MVDQPSLQLKGSGDREHLKDYIAALKTVRSIRGVFFGLLVLSLLVPLACFAGAEWGKLQQPEAAQLSTEESTVEVSSGGFSDRLYDIADATLMLGPFVARLMTLLLILTYFITVHMCLTGRLGGANDSIVAFFWAVFLFLLLIPWQNWIGGGERMRVFYDLGGLLDAQDSLGGDWLTKLTHYVRFIFFPFLGLLTAVVADIRFGRCYRLAMARIRQRLESGA